MTPIEIRDHFHLFLKSFKDQKSIESVFFQTPCMLISVPLQISKVHLRIAISQSIFELETISWPFFGSIFHVLSDVVKKIKV